MSISLSDSFQKVGDKQVKLQIWDTAGQERFRTITSAYYRGADGIIMVYDVSSQDSFDNVQDWLTEVNRFSSADTVKALVGNKSDRPDKAVSTEAGTKYAKEHNMPFLETSAKTSGNVEEAFLAVAEELIKIHDTNGDKWGPRQKSTTIEDRNTSSNKSCC